MRPLSLTRETRLALLAGLFASYFGSLWGGALHFPHGYDWRRDVISNLLSPRDNPGWYWLPAAGVALAGLCMAPLAAWMDGALGDGESMLARRVRRPAFVIGITCLILSAVVAPRHDHPVLGMRHAHEAFARMAAAGLGVGMLSACHSDALRVREPTKRAARLRALRILWRVATVPTLAGAVASGLVVASSRLHWLGPGAAGDLRTTVFWRLAFWEWMGSGAVFLFFAAPVGVLGIDDC